MVADNYKSKPKLVKIPLPLYYDLINYFFGKDCDCEELESHIKEGLQGSKIYNLSLKLPNVEE